MTFLAWQTCETCGGTGQSASLLFQFHCPECGGLGKMVYEIEEECSICGRTSACKDCEVVRLDRTKIRKTTLEDK